jgi:hypothetical protein
MTAWPSSSSPPAGNRRGHGDSVTNPLRRLTGAVHVYGGDFFAVASTRYPPDRGGLRARPDAVV